MATVGKRAGEGVYDIVVGRAGRQSKCSGGMGRDVGCLMLQLSLSNSKQSFFHLGHASPLGMPGRRLGAGNYVLAPTTTLFTLSCQPELYCVGSHIFFSHCSFQHSSSNYGGYPASSNSLVQQGLVRLYLSLPHQNVTLSDHNKMLFIRLDDRMIEGRMKMNFL